MAWWREAFASPVEARPKGEPLLQALNEVGEYIPLNAREALAAAWEHLLGNERFSQELVDAHAELRAEAIFLTYAGWVGTVQDMRPIGRIWALEALRIAGGLTVAVAGWHMLNEEDDNQRRESQAPAALDTAPVERMSFFPLTLPLTTGPGTIAASIALSAERRSSEISDIALNALAFTLTAATVALTVWIAYANAAAVARRLGPTGMLIAAKLAAFVLLCIGAQIMLTGVIDALRPILAKS
jgi:small neutral amino acid transporter SnatA (MarC family)